MLLENKIKLVKNVGANSANPLIKCSDIMALSSCCQIFCLFILNFCNCLIDDPYEIHKLALLCNHVLSSTGLELVTSNGHSSIEAISHVLTSNSSFSFHSLQYFTSINPLFPTKTFNLFS